MLLWVSLSDLPVRALLADRVGDKPGKRINSVLIQFPYDQEEENMSQEEGKKNDTVFWVVLIVLLVLVVVGGAYVRWNFWTG
jgi:hypothetical protein